MPGQRPAMWWSVLALTVCPDQAGLSGGWLGSQDNALSLERFERVLDVASLGESPCCGGVLLIRVLIVGSASGRGNGRPSDRSHQRAPAVVKEESRDRVPVRRDHGTASRPRDVVTQSDGCNETLNHPPVGSRGRVPPTATGRPPDAPPTCAAANAADCSEDPDPPSRQNACPRRGRHPSRFRQFLVFSSGCLLPA